MNKKTADHTVIYADKPIRDYHYMGAFVFFVLFAAVVVWLVFLYLETSDFRSFEDWFFLVGLLVLGGILGWVLFAKVRRLVDASLERPLVRVGYGGFSVFGGELWAWRDIAYIRLICEFDQNFLEFEVLGRDELVCYRLYYPLETAEFGNLERLKAILNEYTDKVV